MNWQARWRVRSRVRAPTSALRAPTLAQQVLPTPPVVPLVPTPVEQLALAWHREASQPAGSWRRRAAAQQAAAQQAASVQWSPLRCGGLNPIHSRSIVMARSASLMAHAVVSLVFVLTRSKRWRPSAPTAPAQSTQKTPPPPSRTTREPAATAPAPASSGSAAQPTHLLSLAPLSLFRPLGRPGEKK